MLWTFRAVVASTFAILVLGFVVPSWIRNRYATQCPKVSFDLLALEQACQDFAVHHGMRYPESLRELVVPDEHGYTYLPGETLPKDPWGNDYLYEPPGEGEALPTIRSLGSDGVPGGEGDARDLDNHGLISSES